MGPLQSVFGDNKLLRHGKTGGLRLNCFAELDEES